MKKVIFFTHNIWAFGAIHNGLCKELYKYGIYADALNWAVQYSPEEFKMLNDVYDFFVTMPEAVLPLHYGYDIPLEKIIAVAHGQWDILLAMKEADMDFYPKINKFAVISQVLKDKCKEWNISVDPTICTLGINFNLFYNKPSMSLKKIGYAGSNETANFFGQEIKRPKLIEKIVNESKHFDLIKHKFYHFTCMPNYYKQIDAVIMSSIEEAGGLPMMEGAAAGKLCLGTPVGYFEHNGAMGGGILLPIEENEFVDHAKIILDYYRINSKEYVKKCLDIQEYARENYDWSKVIHQWVNLFDKSI
jgi:glycosyltransferase involved in cell wall biosynthesis